MFFALLRKAIRENIPGEPEVLVFFDGEQGSAARKAIAPAPRPTAPRRPRCQSGACLTTASLTGTYDIVLMNGCLHYVRDKSSVLDRVTAASAADAVHAVAVFSTATPIPAEHAVIPAFPEEEGGTVEQFYRGWQVLRIHERDRAEHSHPGFTPHAHSHIKLIAARRPETDGTR